MESFIDSAGFAALILFGFLEAACIPISSEVTFGLAGAWAYHYHHSIVLVIVLGTLAELAGSYLSYYVGRIGGRPMVNKLGRYVLVTEADVDRAERFLAGRGTWAIPVGRMLPFIRAFTSLVCGLVRVPPMRFGILNVIGTVIYATALSLLGYNLGSAWTHNKDLTDATYGIVAVVVLIIVGGVFYRWRQFRREGLIGGRHSASGGGTPGTDDAQARNGEPEPSGNAEVR
ncbi:MAG TPA: DedA family protein [Streptosporangiaceae bacterium]|nr:DedA family protein [Streptosporangiaceae bacterium]